MCFGRTMPVVTKGCYCETVYSTMHSPNTVRFKTVVLSIYITMSYLSLLLADLSLSVLSLSSFACVGAASH